MIRKDLDQWFFKITAYAEEFLDFSKLDWPERVQAMQTNWIGRSTGATVIFKTEQTRHAHFYHPSGYAVGRHLHGPGPGTPAGGTLDA